MPRCTPSLCVRLYTRDGELVGSCVQEALIRPLAAGGIRREIRNFVQQPGPRSTLDHGHESTSDASGGIE
jgi:hypothetical protein